MRSTLNTNLGRICLERSCCMSNLSLTDVFERASVIWHPWISTMLYIFCEKAPLQLTHISLSSLAETVDPFSFLECQEEKKKRFCQWMVHQIRTNSIFFNDVDVAVTFTYNSQAQNHIGCKTKYCLADKTQNCTAHSCPWVISAKQSWKCLTLDFIQQFIVNVWRRNAQLSQIFEYLRLLDSPFVWNQNQDRWRIARDVRKAAHPCNAPWQWAWIKGATHLLKMRSRTGPRCVSRPTPLIEKASKHSAGGRSSSKVGMLGRKVSFRSCTLRNSANAATCSLEVVAKMPQHAAKCQRGQGVWQAVKSLLKLLHRLEVKLWRQQKLAPHFCTTLGWQKFGDTLSLSSALFFPGTEKRGAANNHHLSLVFFFLLHIKRRIPVKMRNTTLRLFDLPRR